MIEMIESTASTAIAEYSVTAAALADLRSRLANVAYDVTTGKGLDIAKKDRAEVRSLRTALEAKRVELKAPALERSRLIDAEAKALTAELIALEKPIDEQIKAEESRKAVEKAAKEQDEREAAAVVQEHIDGIRTMVVTAAGLPAAAIDAQINALELLEVTLEAFGDRAGEAAQAQAQTLTKLRGMHLAAVTADEQRAELAREQEALRAAQAAQAEADRLARKAEADRLATERAAMEKERAAMKSEADRMAAERKAIDDAKAEEVRRVEQAAAAERQRAEAEQAAARRRAEDAARAERDAAEAVAAAARKVEQDKADAAAAAERKRLDDIAAAARAERERVEAVKREQEIAALEVLKQEALAADRVRAAAPEMRDALSQWRIAEERNDPEELNNARASRDAVLNTLATGETE